MKGEKKKKAVTALKITTFEVNSTKVLVATSKKLVPTMAKTYSLKPAGPSSPGSMPGAIFAHYHRYMN